MTRQLSALLLLAAFGLGFLLGPHPCAASHAEREQPSCHEGESSPDGPEVRESRQRDGDDCCGTFCQHACQGTAIAAAGPVAFAISPVSAATVELSGSGLPRFAHPIDHIPLA